MSQPGTSHPRLREDDEGLLARVQAPPELADGVESLAYWRRRRERLPWYRRSDRAEAERMVAAWERRVARAAAYEPVAPLRARVDAAALVARSACRRWLRRCGRWAQLRLLAVAAVAGATFALVEALL